jgi:long-chain acyl-CoA synthetase
MSVLSEFLRVAERHSDRPAVVDSTGEWSYGELAGTARRLASVLSRATDSPRVGIMLPTCRAFPAAFLACELAGKVPVPMNFLLEAAPLQHIVKDAALDTVVATGTFEPKAQALGPLKVLLFEKLDLAAAPPMDGCPDWGDHDLATILYTSGTTGMPKGVMLTHRNFTSNVASCRKVIAFTEKDVMIGLLPLFHSFGLTASFLLPCLSGSKAVFLEKFHPGRAAELIERQGVTVLFAIPSMYRFLVRAMESRPFNFRSLRFCISGGEPLEDSLIDAFRKVFGMPLLNGYGLTETSPVVAINRPDNPRRGSIGLPMPDQEAQVVDEAGRVLPVACEGELWLRGPNIMKGYYNLPKETAAVLTDDGWFKTGDMARIDEDGTITITGRKKELIKSSGEFIAPFEIETVIAEHPAVYEVAVIGIPDPSRGEAPKAFVVLRPGASCTEQAIIDHCRSRLAKFKLPKQVEFRSELPHGPTGKVLKRKLKEEGA